MYAGNFGIPQLATEWIKAFCSVRGSIFDSFYRGGIADDPTSMTIELEMELILCVLFIQDGEGKSSRVRKKSCQ